MIHSEEIQKLMLNISKCGEIVKAIKDDNHPCHKIVQYQYDENPENLFQHPEPWNGNIDEAEILFVGSNPSIDFKEAYPTDNWTDNEICDFHSNRFSNDNDYYQKNKNKVKFWQCIRKITSWLLDIPLGEDAVDENNCITEIVHCKSKKEIGVSASCDKCVEKWMMPVLLSFKGTYIVVLGKPAKLRFEKIVDANSEYFKNKKVIYVPHPSGWCYIGKDTTIKQMIMDQI